MRRLKKTVFVELCTEEDGVATLSDHSHTAKHFLPVS